jgi:hypothetical protein
MRLGRPRALPAPVAHQPPGQSLIASAIRLTSLDGRAWPRYKFGDDSWQQEAWRLYDIIGELRFVANWIGSACSRVRIYVAEVDPNGRVQKEVDKKKIAGLADTLFGGPSHKAEALRMLGINLTIAGDAYIVGRGNDIDSDEWFVLSCSELKKYTRTGVVKMETYTGVPEELNPEQDMIIRVWTPHPRRALWADSPTKAAMPMLWEIERLTRYVFAQIDSRLVSAGLLPIPKEVSFPDEDVEVPGAEGLTQMLMKTGSASLKGEGTAAGVVPTIVEMPLEALGKIELIQFGSELSKQALELRAEALRRFALAMDIDPSILSGAGEANHWGAWQIMEGQIKIHIEPLMNRICDALTEAYLQPALKTIKEDPDRYIFWFDTAPLTVRPERLKETQELYRDNIVSAEAVRIAGNYKISDAPDDEEDTKKFVRELMLRDPNLFQIAAVRKASGISEDILPPETVVTPAPGTPGAGPPPPPAPPTGISPTAGGPIPQVTEAQNAPGGPPPLPSGTPPAGITASTSVTPLNIFVVANATVLRALELAGKRMAGNVNRMQFSTPTHELHTMLKLEDPERLDKLMSGAWDHLAILAAQVDPDIDVPTLQSALDQYCRTLIVREKPHQPILLKEYLTRAGLLHDA